MLVFHFALMQNETKDQDCASLHDPIRDPKAKTKKNLLTLISFCFLRFPPTSGTPCNRQGQ